eukprot:350653-Chlamydomonas_euryale.AAC.2
MTRDGHAPEALSTDSMVLEDDFVNEALVVGQMHRPMLLSARPAGRHTDQVHARGLRAAPSELCQLGCQGKPNKWMMESGA